MPGSVACALALQGRAGPSIPILKRRPTTALRLLLNIAWVIFGGVWMVAAWLVAVVVLAITIIGLPWARAARKRCAFRADLNRLICRSRFRVGWCGFSALLFKPLWCRRSAPGMISPFAAPQPASLHRGQSQRCTPEALTTTLSRCNLSPALGSVRRIWLANSYPKLSYRRHTVSWLTVTPYAASNSSPWRKLGGNRE